MNKDKVTVVTVCFNAERLIENTIKSVLGQNYAHVEYIIVDGGSKDNTLNIVNKYKNEIDIIISEPDKGIYDAMNKGIRNATGEWIIFMNAGDCFIRKDTLSLLFEGKQYDNNVGCVYGDYYVTQDEYSKLFKPSPFWANTSYLHSSGICHQASFVRCKLALNLLFDLQYKHAADFKMFLDIYNLGYSFSYVDKPVCLFDITDNFGTRKPWSGIIDQALILNRYKTLRFYLAIFKDAVFIKTTAYLSQKIKQIMKAYNDKAYTLYMKERGWIGRSNVSDF